MRAARRPLSALHKSLFLTALLGVLLAMASCATANPMVVEDGPGFWRGLVHGWIAPVTLVISLFRDDVAIYEVKNTGGWYDFGFLFGLSFWGGGGAAAGRRATKRDKHTGNVKLPSPS